MKQWKKERATTEEKLPLHVQLSSESDDNSDIPVMRAPSPTPWQRQSHLGKLAVNVPADDSHSHDSLDSEDSTTRPPSYNYVMKKSDPKTRSTGGLVSPGSVAIAPAGPPAGIAPAPPGGAAGASGDPVDGYSRPASNKKYIETTC